MHVFMRTLKCKHASNEQIVWTGLSHIEKKFRQYMGELGCRLSHFLALKGTCTNSSV